MDMKNKKRSKIFKAGLIVTLSALFCVGILISISVEDVVEVTPIKERIRIYGDMGDGDPTGDESGFISLRVHPHQAVPATAYASNLSNATSYEVLFSLDGSAVGETPYSTAADYVATLIVNDTVGYNESSSAWEPTNFIFMNIYNCFYQELSKLHLLIPDCHKAVLFLLLLHLIFLEQYHHAHEILH